MTNWREEASTASESWSFGDKCTTYLFAQGGDGLYIIDQHTLLRNGKYEEYREKALAIETRQQQLLVPYISLNFLRMMPCLTERMRLLEGKGVSFSEYGEKKFIYYVHPIMMEQKKIESGIYEMCDMLLLTKEVSIKRNTEQSWLSMSCKRSIKANHRIDDHSARELLYQLFINVNPYNCPHGRPVLVHFTKSRI